MKKGEYITPASAAAGTTSSATNTNFTKNESYPSTSGEWKCKRIMNEHEYALKEVNKALRWFSKTVHCRSAPYTQCEQCNDFKRF